MSGELVAAVELYFALGMSVIPLIAGTKRPRGKWGDYMQERTTPEALVASFGRRAANIGIVSGGVSGHLVVLDIEPEHVDFARERGLLIDTPTVVTARRGMHLFCRGDLRCSRLKVDGRVIGDVRGEGGYVVAPPSQFAGGVYRWLDGRGISDVPMAEVPPWVEIGRKMGSASGAPQGVPSLTALGSPRHFLSPILNTPDQLVRLLPAALRRVAEEGWRKGGAFHSRSEADFAVLIALAHIGASESQSLRLFEQFAIGDKYREHTSPAAYFAHQFREAQHRAADDLRGAVVVRMKSLLTEKQDQPGCAKVRGTLYLTAVVDGKKLSFSFPLVLGPPHNGEFSGEWHSVARAFGHQLETAGDNWKFSTRGEVLAVIRDGAVRQLAPMPAEVAGE